MSQEQGITFPKNKFVAKNFFLNDLPSIWAKN